MSLTRLTASAATTLVALGLASVPAAADVGATEVAIPVSCSDGAVTLRWDDMTYQLEGDCGLVRVLADDATVRMPTAVRLVVRGQRNTVVSKSVDTVVVRGHDHRVRPRSVRLLRVASPGSRVAVGGLLETARLLGRRAVVTADQVSTVRMPGSGNTVRTGFGWDAFVGGDRNALTYRRLDAAVLSSDRNTLRVRRGTTSVRDSGTGNRVVR